MALCGQDIRQMLHIAEGTGALIGHASKGSGLAAAHGHIEIYHIYIHIDKNSSQWPAMLAEFVSRCYNFAVIV